MMTATPLAGILGALGALRDRRESVSLLPTLGGLPVLVMGGAEDSITPRDQVQALAEAIPGAKLVVVPGVGHLSPLERPGATTAAVADFLATIGEAR
jgi:pimeloyl-ACP methyl ester carboxylesterase